MLSSPFSEPLYNPHFHRLHFNSHAAYSPKFYNDAVSKGTESFAMLTNENFGIMSAVPDCNLLCLSSKFCLVVLNLDPLNISPLPVG